jgi:WD40 repeat protein
MAFSPDGQRIVSGSEDRTVRVWDTLSGVCLEVCAGDEYQYQTPPTQPVSPWQVARREEVSAIITTGTDQPIAWCPERLLWSDSAGRIWVGSTTEHVVILALEGRP